MLAPGITAQYACRRRHLDHVYQNIAEFRAAETQVARFAMQYGFSDLGRFA
jgi:hypothetical protein